MGLRLGRVGIRGFPAFRAMSPTTMSKRVKYMNKRISVACMAAIVVASNVGVQFPVAGGWLTWGAFTYPLAFLVTDVTNRLHGVDAARKVVLAGFAAGVVCSLIGTQIEGPYGPLVTFRIALASGVAFLAAQMLDLGVFSLLRRRVWFVAPLVSTLVGSVLDSVLFFTIAFAGFLAFPVAWGDVGWAGEATALGPYWVGLGLADWGVKVCIGLLTLVPFRLLTKDSRKMVRDRA